jgi:outer membrane protein assembly factor BamB
VTASRLKPWLLRTAVVLAAQAALTTQAAAAGLHVIPFPGTPDASPLSQIIFSSVRASELKSVTVTGSSGGAHAGRIVPLPADGGTEFKLDHPFTAGEQVHVAARLASSAAGTAEGDPGATTLKFSFTVATPATTPATATPARTGTRAGWLGQLAGTSSTPTQSFRSDPGIHPPVISATADPDRTSGDIFLTEFTPPPRARVQNGLMILDRRGGLVWFHPLDGWAANLEAQSYQGHPVLTWFQQTFAHGTSNQDVIMDRSYRTVATLQAGDGYRVDMHEFQLTPKGTALVDAYTPVQANLTSIGGQANGAVLDCVIQELDVKTGQVLWEWHSLGHVPVSASYNGRPSGWPPYEYFHLNSIQQLPDGNLLISARDTWSVYEIDKQTGRVIWTLGGRYSSFRMGPGTNFEWQHDARLSGDRLSLFDDAALPQEESQSSAKILRLDTVTMTASLLKRYVHSPPVLTSVEGSAQILANHDVFVGWGRQPLFSEYSASGKQIFAGSLPFGTNSYRAYRFPWTGHPKTRPSVALAKQRNGSVKLYVSWNGATQVSSWRVRGGSSPGARKALTTARRSGFQTTIVLSHPPRYLAVQALNGRGKVIGTSARSRS